MAIHSVLAVALTALISIPVAAPPPGTSAAAMRQSTAPSVPGTPVATEITETSALLTWSPSTDDVGVTEYDIWYVRDGGNGYYNSTRTPYYRFAWLTPDTSYTWMIRASDGTSNSGFSAPVTFRTDPAPVETEPPTAPGAPVVSDVTPTTVTLHWPPSTDNASALNYRVYASAEGVGYVESMGGGYETWTVADMLIPDLHYDFHVIAQDVSGNLSAPSPTTRARTAADPDGSCRAEYHHTAGSGRARVLVTNTGPAFLSAWSVRMTYPEGEGAVSATGTWTQDGQDLVVWWSGWGGGLAVGGVLRLDIQPESDAIPIRIALNGVPCAT